MKIRNRTDAHDYLLRASIPCPASTLACFLIREDLELDEVIMHDPKDGAGLLANTLLRKYGQHTARAVLIVNFAGVLSKSMADDFIRELNVGLDESAFEVVF